MSSIFIPDIRRAPPPSARVRLDLWSVRGVLTLELLTERMMGIVLGLWPLVCWAKMVLGLRDAAG